MTFALPKPFEEEFRTTFGPELFSRVRSGLTLEEPVVSIRVNGQKASISRDSSDRVAWFNELGTYITGDRPLFGADPLWHVGAYYVQEAGSMFVSRFLSGERPQVVLDLCAAPGGKSTLLRDAFGAESGDPMPLLICNEPAKDRASILSENIHRWGADETIVVSALPDALAASGLKADLILVDAPCSGEGMFRKDPESIKEWSPGNVDTCVKRQRDILSSAWEMLTDGGLLIYSTCTLNARENEDQLLWLLEHYDSEQLLLDAQWDRLCLLRPGVYRFMPGLTRSEGLTIFAVRKRSGSGPIRKRKNTPFAKSRLIVPETLSSLPGTLHRYNDVYFHLGDEGQRILDLLTGTKGIQIRSAGVPIGEQKGKDFVPNQSWVCSPILSKALPFPKVEVDTDTALALLKRENVLVESGHTGFHLVTYRGLPLTIIKHLGNRTNSLFPKEWAIRNSRISSSDIPSLPLIVHTNE